MSESTPPARYEIVYQGDVTGARPASDSDAAWLMQSAFPLAPPPSLRAAEDYLGMKLVFDEDRVSVSRFGFVGAQDKFGRSTPSASSLWLKRSHYREGWRDLASLRTALIGPTQPAPLGGVADWQRALRDTGLGMGILAFAYAAHHESASLRVHVGAREEVAALMDALFLLGWKSPRSWSEYAYTEAGEMEDIVTLTAPLPAAGGFFSKLKGMLGGGPDGPPRMDLRNGETRNAVVGKSALERLEEVLKWLREDGGLGNCSWEEFDRILKLGLEGYGMKGERSAKESLVKNWNAKLEG